MSLDYLTFDIRLIRVPSSAGQGTLVVEGSGAVGEARDIIRFADGDLSSAQPQGPGLFRHLVSPQAAKNKAFDPAAMKEWTRKLTDYLMPTNVRSLYDAMRYRAQDKQKGVRIRVFTYDPEIAAIQWEAAYVGNDPLCLTSGVSVVRYVPAGQTPQPIVVSSPVRILGIVGKPANQPPLDHEKEKSEIEAAFQALDPNVVKIDWLPTADPKALQIAKLKSYQIVHYIGHGAYDPVTGVGSLAFDNGNVDPTSFFMNLGRKVGFVLLNACDTGHEAGGIAEELVRRGIPTAMGMRRLVRDDSAIEFAQMFYSALASGISIDEAVGEGRIAILNHLKSGYDSNDQWLQPILYTRAPDTAVFV